MSVTNTNTALANFENGGRLLIETGSGTYLNLLNIKAGTLRMRIGRRRVVYYNDRNKIQPPRLAEQQPSMLELDVRATAAYGSSDIMKLLLPIPTTDAAPTVKLHVEIPTYDGSSTVLRWTFAKAIVERPIDFEAGPDDDAWKLRFTDAAEMAEPTSGSPLA